MNWKIVYTLSRVKRYCNPQMLRIEINRTFRHLKKNPGLTNINFSFTNLCSMDCIFCPSKRGNKNVKFMRKEVLEKILKECSCAAFKKNHNIQVVSVSENGDMFLHENCLEYLSMIRKVFRGAKIRAYTNFRMFTPDKIDFVLRRNLIDFIGCNIDGHDKDNYFKVKRGDLDIITANLFYFLKKRRELWRNIPVHIPVLTYSSYLKGLYYGLRITPKKLPGMSKADIDTLQDDYLKICSKFMPWLDHPKDKIFRSDIVGWAEREQFAGTKCHNNGYTCPQLVRIEKEAFIAPDGSWYACCWDAHNEIVLGNAFEQTIDEIYFSDKRNKLIRSLKEREFSRIGGPCATVQCCQQIKIA